MKLLQYQKLSGIDDEAMAAGIGCSVSAYRKWKRGERMPRAKMLERIVRMTEAAVTANDFHDFTPLSSRPDTLGVAG